MSTEPSHFQSLDEAWKISKGLLVTVTHAGPGPNLECPLWMTQLSLGSSRNQT